MSDNLTSLDTVSPVSPNYIEGVSAAQTTSEVGISPITEGISPVTTVLPVRPVNIEVVPNPDILNISNLIDKGVQTISTENTIIITEVIPVFPDSLDSGVLQYADLTAKATEHFS
jgi:hypothetical protein